ncbi:hypothetical protein ACOV5J_02705 [Weissella soli]|uniref:hypothetical protein n=1 Tax=Weissella soli TaxID=155866 RepID=UPI003C7409AA
MEENLLVKVPTITLIFWLTKLVTTGMAESLSDTLAKSIGPIPTLIFAVISFGATLYWQVTRKQYHVISYWLPVATLAILGTIMADAVHGGLHISHYMASILFFGLMLASFMGWFLVEHDISIHTITTRRAELFYWLTVSFSFMLGTALGDYIGNDLGLGLFLTGVFLSILLVIALTVRQVFVRHLLLETGSFWVAYILTRPIGASFADYFGLKWHNGALGSQGLSIIWLVMFIVLIGIMVRTDVVEADVQMD